MLAIIGGSGLYSLTQDFDVDETASPHTAFGSTSAELVLGSWRQLPLVFLPRHGPGHKLPPHRINYRANIAALHQLGVTRVVAVNAVGGISDAMAPLTLVLPDQIIDYSSGREATFFDGDDGHVQHIDFSQPYSHELRSQLQNAAMQNNQQLVAAATYGCTNGPRLETAAEINRMARDGCHIVGMTAMPEAALCRELEMEYASLCLVVNWAAGIQQETISMEQILKTLDQGMSEVLSLLSVFVEQLQQ